MSFICNQCPNRCGVDREITRGRCKCPEQALISRIALHPWEEPIISGTRGSGTIFFAGCSMGCVFCQNYEISHQMRGVKYTIDDLIAAIKDLERQGAHNINFVNPTHYAHVVKEVLTRYQPSVPVVYNTGGYDSVETLRDLEGLVDIYLPDYKYMDEDIAMRYSKVKDYPQVAWDAIAEMVRQQPTLTFDEQGLLQKGVIIRHLVLPSHAKHSAQLVQKLYTTYGEKVYYSIMSQYVPHGKAGDYPEIDRPLKPLEYKVVVSKMEEMGAKQVFLQDCEAAKEDYIPAFEGEIYGKEI